MDARIRRGVGTERALQAREREIEGFRAQL